MPPTSLTVVGASLAGLRGAEAARRAGFDGPITIIGDEPHAPYDRPPLSKQVLAGDWEPDRLTLSKPEAVADLDIEIRAGVTATGFDLADRRLSLRSAAGDESVAVDAMLIATGARCRTLPGTEAMTGVHVLRSLDDCLALRADLDATPQRVVVVGAGFIGAEVAATARTRGLDVTLIEALPPPLGRVLGDAMGAVCAAVHRDHGVDLRTGVGVDGLDADGTAADDGRVTRVRLSDGSTVTADVVVVGIGVIPNTEWLEGSGIQVNQGIPVDDRLRKGDQLSGPLFDSPLIPRSVAQMVFSGEKSGRLGSVLNRIATYTEEDLDDSIRSATQFIEPVMIIGMGILIGFLAIALLLPIFSAGRVMAG